MWLPNTDSITLTISSVSCPICWRDPARWMTYNLKIKARLFNKNGGNERFVHHVTNQSNQWGNQYGSTPEISNHEYKWKSAALWIFEEFRCRFWGQLVEHVVFIILDVSSWDWFHELAIANLLICLLNLEAEVIASVEMLMFSAKFWGILGFCWVSLMFHCTVKKYIYIIKSGHITIRLIRIRHYIDQKIFSSQHYFLCKTIVVAKHSKLSE